jgi:hypothetical protein
MEKEDLRVGNVVSHIITSEPVIIRSLTNDSVMVCSETCNNKTLYYENITGIRITDEWLQEIGLKQVGYMKEGNYYLPNNKYIIGNEQANGMRILSILSGAVVTNRCNYRHELVNLYYALCGEILY